MYDRTTILYSVLSIGEPFISEFLHTFHKLNILEMGFFMDFHNLVLRKAVENINSILECKLHQQYITNRPFGDG